MVLKDNGRNEEVKASPAEQTIFIMRFRSGRDAMIV